MKLIAYRFKVFEDERWTYEVDIEKVLKDDYDFEYIEKVYNTNEIRNVAFVNPYCNQTNQFQLSFNEFKASLKNTDTFNDFINKTSLYFMYEYQFPTKSDNLFNSIISADIYVENNIDTFEKFRNFCLNSFLSSDNIPLTPFEDSMFIAFSEIQTFNDMSQEYNRLVN